MGNNRILVVDDSKTFRTLMVHILDTHGYQVATAEDGEEALPKLTAFQPALVLMDAQMPVLDGYDACRRIKDNPATCDIPVVMMSADSRASHDAVAAGADDFMAKPFCLDDLLLKIKSLTSLDASSISPAAFQAVGSVA